MAVSIKKNSVHPKHSDVVRKVDDSTAAVTLLQTVATLIALARMLVAKTSEGINHAPGPMPMEKNDKYKPSPAIAVPSFENAINVSEKAMPTIAIIAWRRLVSSINRP